MGYLLDNRGKNLSVVLGLFCLFVCFAGQIVPGNSTQWTAITLTEPTYQVYLTEVEGIISD